MKAFSSEVLEAINANSKTGRLVEAMIVTRDQDNPSLKDYFIRYERVVTFKGNTYQPLGFAWVGMKVNSVMELPSNQVLVNNVGGIVIDYLEDPTVNVDQNDVVLQVLFIDHFGRITLTDEMLFQVEAIVADYYKSCTIHLGVNWSLNDIIPRNTIETQEFPGIRDDVIRVGT